MSFKVEFAIAEYDEVTSFDMQKHINNFLESVAKQKERMIKDCLTTNAVPPIKGEITAGKVKWRGIKFYEQGNYMWIAQRGKRISPKWGKISYEATNENK